MAETPKMQVHTGDLARQALERLTSQSAALQDAFRHLLSYCETAAATSEKNGRLDLADAYDDVAGKLRELLDGE